ncbi:ubiquinone biosynthesis accessory factor UbiJ [Methylocucumis oryzae]|uniref:Ubiquinone biosynthesis accessory factor UbiJ n=1 Tax=Methylocucumis oryzae TaxID=1632867 RepID=A0A0F3IFB8_9GAMM|nr:SCP2 sterol-binding domain-containing protein [Methylocucumis oryzae]KJV05456.1 hypothetical protein VZ94_18110 [Methylocucumis oryzae]
MAVQTILLDVLQTALNQLLSLDNNHALLLAPLNGKVVEITVLPFQERLYFSVTDDRISLSRHSLAPVDARLSGSVFAFIKMGVSKHPMQTVFAGEATISGDVRVARDFQKLLKKVNIEPEAKLAQLTSPEFAHEVSEKLNAGWSWSQDSLTTFKLNLSEFLQEEVRTLPAAPEIEAFYQEVDELRLDYDRLALRIARLQARLTSATPPTLITHTPEQP